MACGDLNRPSPDGRFLAISETSRNFGKVFVVPIQGGEPQLVSDIARLIDWTRDGRYLSLSSALPASRRFTCFRCGTADGRAIRFSSVMIPVNSARSIPGLQIFQQQLRIRARNTGLERPIGCVEGAAPARPQRLLVLHRMVAGWLASRLPQPT